MQMPVTRGALVAHVYTYAPHRCRTSQYRMTFIPLSMSLWNDLDKPHIRWCGTGGFQDQGQCFLIGLSCSIPAIVFYTIFLFLFFLSIGWYCGAGVFGMIGFIALYYLALPTFNNNNNNNNDNG